jgi:hypothetical protein
MTSVAAAEPVLLVAPKQDDPKLVDAFHRVEAELHIHHFETLLEDADLEAAGAPSLGTLAERRHALAAIAFSLRAGQTQVDIWLLDRTTGESRVRTLDAGQGADAASLIAVRAVDLLRVNLGELVPEEPAAPEPKPHETAADSEPSPPTAAEERAFWLYADGCILRPGSAFGFSFGPALAFMYRATPWLHVGVNVAVPLTAMTLETPNGNPSLQQEFATLEVRLPFLRAGRFSAAPLVAVGAYFLQARGHAMAPLIPQNDNVAAMLLSAGAQAEVRLWPRVSVNLSVRGLALLPRLGVKVVDYPEVIDPVALEAQVGVGVGL